uniref:Long-chain-fatty-acid--CoA ligase n=1 Tax=Photinus pyralis TaxID=7054 RepID=A0A1Y1LXN2_PHOPY
MWCLVAVISLLLFIFNYGRWSRLLNRLGKEFKTLRVYTLLFYTVATKYKRSVCENFDQLVATHPQKVLFYFQDEIWTSSKVKEESNKVSLYFESRGYRRGDVVAIMLDNCPEYICLWLGLAQIGVVPALINTNIVKDALVHSLSVAKCSAVIYGSNYGPTINDIAKQFTNLEKYQLPCKTADEGLSGEIDLRTELRNIDPYTFIQKLKFRRNDVLMFIFTSGTTGLPKAALLSHAKYSLLSSTAILLPPNSVIYCPMPLYHASGSVLGVGQALIWGNTVVLRKKFSASNFWSDCIQYRCNVSLIILF